MNSGKLLVISGPSGVGKSTAIEEVRKRRPDIYFSISATTRPRRPGDENGVNYWFCTEEEFHRKIQEGAFYEHASYAGHEYGTPRAPVESRLEAGTDVIMDIDVQGALQIQKRCKESVLIFLAAPSWRALVERLRGRGDTSPEDMSRRLERAKWEYAQAPRYDYILKSDIPQKTAEAILHILYAERSRASRGLDLLKWED